MLPAHRATNYPFGLVVAVLITHDGPHVDVA